MAIAFFLLIVAVTIGITFFAARRTRTADDFYVASGRVGGFSNGLAIAGDFISSVTLLGISATILSNGFDAVIYLGAPLVAFSILIFLMTDKLKELGRYTFTDIACARLQERPIRIFAAISTLVFAMMYLMVQVVGAGALIQVLFGIPYAVAVVIVTTLMVFYVAIGGMLATTWVQITKAVLLVLGITSLALLTLAEFNFDFTALYAIADANHPTGNPVMQAGGLDLSAFSSLSLGLSLCFGLAGSPHLLMRFFTVPDARAARQSAAVALGAIAFVNMMIFFVIGAGGTALVHGNTAYQNAEGTMEGGRNMVAMHLAHAVGGEIFFGIMAAIAFATILAVVAGLTLAAVSALSHDLYANAIRRGQVTEREQLRFSRLATVFLGVAVMVLGIAFEGQNIAYLASLVMAIGGSTNFPLLILSIYWRGLTTRGAVIGGATGLVTAIALMVLGPAIWVGVFGNSEPIVDEAYPALFAIIAAFGTMFIVSMLDRSPQAASDRERFRVMTPRADV